MKLELIQTKSGGLGIKSYRRFRELEILAKSKLRIDDLSQKPIVGSLIEVTSSASKSVEH